MSTAAGLTTLVVEDHDFQRRTIARMLLSHGAKAVLQARDGREALDLIQNVAKVDIVLCDLDMPEMDGLEFLRHLGQAHCSASVIICSAQERALLGSVEKMAHAYGVQLLGVIEKPVTLKRIEKLIARHRAGNEQAPPAPPRAPAFTLEQILLGLQQKQFEPFFQPKMDLETERVVGAEALARWRHPEQGLIGPYAFIPLLEQNRQLETLTFTMLETASAACRELRERGLDLTVSVNLSLVSLNDTALADRITDTVRASRLDPHHMILEITETAAMTEEAPALENLARLRMRGFGLAVDDYGTGFSSLRQLTRVPFSELKIDQGFVTGFSANPSSRTIVESSVQMARRLGIKSVAEGVETRDDWDTLKTLGCNTAQGYFIAKPMDKSAFQSFCLNA